MEVLYSSIPVPAILLIPLIVIISTKILWDTLHSTTNCIPITWNINYYHKLRRICSQSTTTALVTPSIDSLIQISDKQYRVLSTIVIPETLTLNIHLED